VLVVDDDPAIRLLCSVNLELAGVTVLQACDGESALAWARSDQPDLVLTDVRMPRLDGFELAQALRADERTRQIPVIFVSAETSATSQAHALTLGALAYITKPFDPAALVATAADAIAVARRRTQQKG
jgi:DNA-binding response OmpR family regulator